jgi:hypothetical protein
MYGPGQRRRSQSLVFACKVVILCMLFRLVSSALRHIVRFPHTRHAEPASLLAEPRPHTRLAGCHHLALEC